MNISAIRHAVISRLGFKSILLSVLLISVLSVALSVFFVTRQKRLLMDELHKRAYALVTNFAHSSRIPYMAGDRETLLNNVDLMKQHDDITDAFITRGQGRVIHYHSDSTRVNTGMSIPDGADPVTILRGDFLSAGSPDTLRIVSPVFADPGMSAESIEYTSPDPKGGKNGVFNGSHWPACFAYFDSTRITFSYSPPYVTSLTSSMWIIDFETGEYECLKRLEHSGVHHCWWSHDGRYFAYHRRPPGESDPGGMSLGVWDTVVHEWETDKEWIARETSEGIYPTQFSNDGEYLLTTMQVPWPEAPHEWKFGHALCRIPVTGGEPEVLAFPGGGNYWPETSFDGKWILFQNMSWNPPNKNIIYVYNTETGEYSPVFPDGDFATRGGCFAPDNRHICYVRALQDGGYDLFIADFPYEEGSGNFGRRLTFDGGLKTTPEWSKNGTWIVYTGSTGRTVGGSNNIFIIPAEGGTPVNLTHGQNVLYSAVLDISLENVNSELAAAVRNAFLITLAMILVGSLAMIVLVRSIAGPIHTLAEASAAVGGGDFDREVAIDRRDEIGVLADSFNDMVRRLKVSRDKLDAWNRELEEKVTERTAELEKSHSDLEKAYGELETLDKTKDDFLSLVSHELRTPLSSVLLYSEMLLDGLANDEKTRNEFLTTIVENCKRLTRLINDVLDLSKIEAGRMPFSIEDLHIRQLVEETYNGVRPSLETHGITFDYSGVDENATLRGDRDKVVQVLTNIVSNAVKFTPEGGSITVTLTHGKKTGEIAVRDTGKGIKKDDIPKVFDRFSQIESIDHHSGGSGLGMTISKSIVERLGGKIWIESELKKGTTVFFTLPSAKTPKETGNHKEDTVET